MVRYGGGAADRKNEREGGGEREQTDLVGSSLLHGCGGGPGGGRSDGLGASALGQRSRRQSLQLRVAVGRGAPLCTRLCHRVGSKCTCTGISRKILTSPGRGAWPFSWSSRICSPRASSMID